MNWVRGRIKRRVSWCLKQGRRCEERHWAELEEDKLVVEVGVKQPKDSDMGGVAHGSSNDLC